MKIYHTQEEMLKDIKNKVLVVDDNVTFEFSFSLDISLKIKGDINAWNITAGDITVENITAWNITSGDINARDIDVWDITARDITARNIIAGDINAWDITAWDIIYYAFCCVYRSIKCLSIKATRKKHQPPVCLDGELIIERK